MLKKYQRIMVKAGVRGEQYAYDGGKNKHAQRDRKHRSVELRSLSAIQQDRS
jgi:hypothetical protein